MSTFTAVHKLINRLAEGIHKILSVRVTVVSSRFPFMGGQCSLKHKLDLLSKNRGER